MQFANQDVSFALVMQNSETLVSREFARRALSCEPVHTATDFPAGFWFDKHAWNCRSPVLLQIHCFVFLSVNKLPFWSAIKQVGILKAILTSPVSIGVLAENASSAMINLLRSKLSIPFHSIATSSSPSLSRSNFARGRTLGVAFGIKWALNSVAFFRFFRVSFYVFQMQVSFSKPLSDQLKHEKRKRNWWFGSHWELCIVWCVTSTTFGVPNRPPC